MADVVLFGLTAIAAAGLLKMDERRRKKEKNMVAAGTNVDDGGGFLRKTTTTTTTTEGTSCSNDDDKSNRNSGDDELQRRLYESLVDGTSLNAKEEICAVTSDNVVIPNKAIRRSEMRLNNLWHRATVRRNENIIMTFGVRVARCDDAVILSFCTS